MASFNNITIVGYLGREPELRYTQNDRKPVCDFSVATTDKRGGNENTIWFKITAWGNTAEAAAQYLSKGSQVYVSGPLTVKEYNDRDGNKRFSLKVTAADLKFLNGSNGDGGQNRSGTQGSKSQARTRPAARPEPQQAPPVTEDDIPF